MSSHSHYMPTEYDYAPEVSRAKDIRACDKMLALLRQSYPERAKIVTRQTEKPVARPAPLSNEAMAAALKMIETVERTPVEPPVDFTGLKIRQIQAATGRHFKIKYDELCSQGRTAAVVRARQVGMYICKTQTQRSFPEIGRKFGGRDHTTVIHAVRKIAANLPKYESDIKAIMDAVEVRP